MNAKERILQSLRSAEAEKKALPEYYFSGNTSFLLEDFLEMASSSGIEILDSKVVSLEEVFTDLQQKKKLQTSLEAFKDHYPIRLNESDPFNEEGLPDVFVCQTAFGVAENAAMWLDDSLLPSRILAFLPEELILVLKRDALVPTMQQAYQIVEERNYSYGLFMAGPSKTADIEQTLVTGAQGAKKLSIFLD